MSMVFALVKNRPVVVISTQNMDVAVVTFSSIVSHSCLTSPGVFASLITVEHSSVNSHIIQEGPVVSSEVKVHISIFFWDKVLGNTVSRNFIWHPLVSVNFIPFSGVISRLEVLDIFSLALAFSKTKFSFGGCHESS